MKKKNKKIETDDLAVYEPVNSKYREKMFMKWRFEEKRHDLCEIKCKDKNHRKDARERQQLLQPWP